MIVDLDRWLAERRACFDAESGVVEEGDRAGEIVARAEFRLARSPAMIAPGVERAGDEGRYAGGKFPAVAESETEFERETHVFLIAQIAELRPEMQRDVSILQHARKDGVEKIGHLQHAGAKALAWRERPRRSAPVRGEARGG
jgi:hypothetical protein